MWQEEVVNDLFDAGVENDKLALLHKVNQVNKVAVKTPSGLSERKESTTSYVRENHGDQ